MSAPLRLTCCNLFVGAATAGGCRKIVSACLVFLEQHTSTWHMAFQHSGAIMICHSGTLTLWWKNSGIMFFDRGFCELCELFLAVGAFVGHVFVNCFLISCILSLIYWLDTLI
uniref:Secreted protein n=1 Tax=Amblyomma americanum TaxID=6943 RepID=A0A0C9RW98_AMBAM